MAYLGSHKLSLAQMKNLVLQENNHPHAFFQSIWEQNLKTACLDEYRSCNLQVSISVESESRKVHLFGATFLPLSVETPSWKWKILKAKSLSFLNIWGRIKSDASHMVIFAPEHWPNLSVNYEGPHWCSHNSGMGVPKNLWPFPDTQNQTLFWYMWSVCH